MSNRRYSSIKNDYCITFDSRTKVKKCSDNSNQIAKVAFTFTRLDSIEGLNSQAVIDVIGVIVEVAYIENLQLKDGS